MATRPPRIDTKAIEAGRDQVLKQAKVDFGRRVRTLRELRGLTQEQLAERLSKWGRTYHQTTVAKLERGARPTSLEELIPLAAELGVEQRAFFDEPSPAIEVAHRVRMAETEIVEFFSELKQAEERVAQIKHDITVWMKKYAELVEKWRELDPEAAADRLEVVATLTEQVARLEGDDASAAKTNDGKPGE